MPVGGLLPAMPKGFVRILKVLSFLGHCCGLRMRGLSRRDKFHTCGPRRRPGLGARLGEGRGRRIHLYLDLPGMRFFLSFTEKQKFLLDFFRIAICLQNRLSDNHETETALTKLLH